VQGFVPGFVQDGVNPAYPSLEPPLTLGLSESVLPEVS